jgi:hypothetical protein
MRIEIYAAPVATSVKRKELNDMKDLAGRYKRSSLLIILDFGYDVKIC